MVFAHPQAFYLLALLVPFLLLIFLNYRKKKKLLRTFLSENAVSKLGRRSGREIDFFKAALMCLALVFFIGALAGPQWGEVLEEVDIKGIEMIFLLDTSNSMNAEDLKPNRLEVAKQLIKNVVDQFDTDYVGLINFAGSAYVQCPLTVDYEAFKLLTEASVISPDEEQGTDFSRPFELAINSFRSSTEKNKIIILITDGEDQEAKWQDKIRSIKEQNTIVFTVGVGAPSGAPIPVKNDSGDITGWKKDKQGNIVRTRLDQDTLIQIASETGGQYFHITDVSAIDIFLKNLKSFERDTLSKRMKLSKRERYHLPLAVGILLLIMEMGLTEKKLSWKRN